MCWFMAGFVTMCHFQRAFAGFVEISWPLTAVLSFLGEPGPHLCRFQEALQGSEAVRYRKMLVPAPALDCVRLR